MTDLLDRSHEDTGEIPLVDEHTQPLAPYADLPPARRPDADPDITGEVRLVEPMIGGFLRPASPEPPTQPQPLPVPDPMPPAPRPPVPTDVYAAQPVAPLERVLGDADVPEYVGRHRQPEGAWPVLRSVLADAWARIRRSM